MIRRGACVCAHAHRRMYDVLVHGTRTARPTNKDRDGAGRTKGWKTWGGEGQICSHGGAESRGVLPNCIRIGPVRGFLLEAQVVYRAVIEAWFDSDGHIFDSRQSVRRTWDELALALEEEARAPCWRSTGGVASRLRREDRATSFDCAAAAARGCRSRLRGAQREEMGSWTGLSD